MTRAPETLAACHQRLRVAAEEAGMRLDQFLAARVERLSRTLARRLIELGGVHCNGRRQRQCARTMAEGDSVEFFIDGQPLTPFRLAPDAILYRDGYLLVLSKPAGIETQPTPARYQGTLYAALLEYLRDPNRPHQEPSLGMVQRLDRDTSGVIVFSIHPRAHRGLTTAFAERQARKSYLALVQGQPPSEGEIRSQLARCRDNRVRSVPHGGREAITRFRVLERFPAAALLEVELLTGRSHQIRAHLAEAGHPLLGDVRYGGPVSCAGAPILRQMLHSRTLALAHPVDRRPLQFEAPLPADMTRLLELLRAGCPVTAGRDAECQTGATDHAALPEA